jgi:hypothetical protein
MSKQILNSNKVVVVSVFFIALLMLLVAFVPQQSDVRNQSTNVPDAAVHTYYVNFTESGFSGYDVNSANGWYWSVGLSYGESNRSYGATNSFQLSNGTYSFSVGYYNSLYAYAINPSSGTVYVNGNTKGINVHITFTNTTPAPVIGYDANFTVTNLPSVIPNVSWYFMVTITGVNVQYSNLGLTSGTTVKFTGLPSGNYDYRVSNYPFGTSLTPSSGSISVSKNTTIGLTFSQLKDYKVNFDSSGLTSSESFTVAIDTSSSYNPVYLTENTSYPSLSYVGFSLPNGTYYYTVSISGTSLYPNPSLGTFTVNGGSVVVSIQFTTPPKGYAVTFNITNLPAKLPNYQFAFYVGIDYSYYYLENYGTSITDILTNGSYSFNVGFYGTPPPSTLTSGLSPSSGDFAVQGKNVLINITLLPPTPVFPVKLLETGLQNGQFFSARIGPQFNITQITSTTDYLGFSLPNGSYDYTINQVPGYGVSPSSGQLIINGASEAVQVTFYRGFYVNFTASNLPSNIQNGGFSFEVKLVNAATGQISDHSSSTATVSFSNIPAGIYTYSVATYGNYQIVKSSGTVTVNTTNVNVILNVSSVKTYTVTFSETGLLPDTEWGVVVDNGFVYSSNSFAGFEYYPNVVSSPMVYTINLPNGTYSVQAFTVGAGRFATFSSPQSITVNGKMSNNTVSFTNSVPSAGSNSAVLTDTVLGVVGGLAVGIAAVTAFMYFRKKPPAVTPKSD